MSNEQDDADLFIKAMKGVKPLRQNLAEIQRRHHERQPQKQATHNEPETQERGFRRSGVQRNVMRKLQGGQIPIEGALDLHGSTIPEAQEKLRSFLHNSQTGRQRAVRVIHGKGHRSLDQRSVLKEKVDSWLRQSEMVLAFCEAGPNDGGSGAVRVLLKSR